MLENFKEYIRNTFRSDTYNVLGSVDEKSEISRIDLAQKIYDYYSGDSERILEHLKKALEKTFTKDDIENFQLLYLPVARKVIEKLCKVYSGGVVRELDTPEKTKKLQSLLSNSDIELKQLHWHRMAQLFTTVMVQIVVREIDGEKKICFDVWTPNKITVKEKAENYLEAESVILSMAWKDEIRYVVWTDTEHYLTDHKGNKLKSADNPEGVNPYGTLPFVPLRMRETENFWGEGETTLINAEEKIDVLFVQLMDLLIMQSHGQPVLKNADVKGDIKVGARYPLKLENARGENSDFFFASPQGNIKGLTDAIDWLIMRTMNSYGISQSSTQTDSTVVSGYSKKMDNWDIIEKRDEDVKILVDFEKRLFKKLKIISRAEGLGDFEDGEIKITFTDYGFPESEMTTLQAKEKKLELGLWNPTQDLMDEDKGMTEEKALGIVRKNLSIRNELKDEFGFGNKENSNESTTEEQQT